MGAIKVGDTVYVRRDTYSFKYYQVKGMVTDIRSVPSYPRGRVKLYSFTREDGAHDSTYFQKELSGKRIRLIRKTPFDGLPLLHSREEIDALSEYHVPDRRSRDVDTG